MRSYAEQVGNQATGRHLSYRAMQVGAHSAAAAAAREPHAARSPGGAVDLALQERAHLPDAVSFGSAEQAAVRTAAAERVTRRRSQLTQLTELDAQLSLWRYRHAVMVQVRAASAAASAASLASASA